MTYPVGSFFLTDIQGRIGFLVALGQLLCRKPSRYSHCGVIVTADGATIEGQPGGARPGHLADYTGRPVKVCDGPVQIYLAQHAGHPSLVSTEAVIRDRIAHQALALRGTPYSGLDYVALALLHLGLPSGWVRRRVESSGHLICSALVDRALTRAGIHLFAGRLSGDVLPADLADWADNWEATRDRTAA